MLQKILLLITSFLISVGFTECSWFGDDEPTVVICVITGKPNNCYYTDKSKPDFTRTTKEMIGYSCAGPEDIGEMALHHKDLHYENDLCE